MELSKQSIKRFKKIYHEDYGVELSDEQAYELACKFFAMMQAIVKPIPNNEE
jgi:hypothetical protein